MDSDAFINPRYGSTIEMGGRPAAIPPRPSSHGADPEIRMLATRSRALSDTMARGRRSSTPQTVRELVQVYDGGSMSTQPNVVYWTHPVEIDADDAEGATPTFVADTDQTIPVVFLRTAPAAGDYAVAHAIAGRWVAEKGGKPPQKCWWLCGARVVIDPPADGGCDGAYASAVVADNGSIASVHLDYGGGGCYSVAHPAVTFIGGGSGSGAAATATVGEVTSIAVSKGGSGYSQASPPTVTIDAPGGSGTRATATATVDGTGAVVGIQVTSGGSLYQAPNPNVTIAAPAGAGVQATATATAQPGVVTGLVLTAPGSGYNDNSVPPYLDFTMAAKPWSFSWQLLLQDPIPTTDHSTPPCSYLGTTTVDFPATAFTKAIKGARVTATMGFGPPLGWQVQVFILVQADTSQQHDCAACDNTGQSKVFGLVASAFDNIGPTPTFNTSADPPLFGTCPTRPYSATYTYQIVPECYPVNPPDGGDWYVLAGGDCTAAPPGSAYSLVPIPVTLTVSEP